MGRLQNIRAVARRELRIIGQRPIYFFGTIVPLVLSTIFYLTFFGEGTAEKLPVGVVDMDRASYFSKALGRELGDNQLCKVVTYKSFVEARTDMQKGKIAGFVVIPDNTYKDVLSFRRPTFAFYINGLYFVGGSMAYKELLTMANMGNGAVEREFLRAYGYSEDEIMGMIQPIIVECHPIGNKEINFNYYLSSILLPAVLSMIIIIILIYSLGSEMKYGTSRHLLRTSGNSITVAIAGKLYVYTILFSILGLGLIFLLYDSLHFPMAGHVWTMALNMLLLVLSSEAMAIFFIGIFPVTRLAMSAGALYSILAFSFSGFTLPVEQMPTAIQSLAIGFPIRHYYLYYVQDVLYGTGFAGWWQEAVHMLLFLFLPLMVMPRLKKAYIYLNFPRN